MTKKITALEYINDCTERINAEIKHLRKMHDKLMNEAMDEVDKYYSGDSGKDLKKKIKNLAIKYDNAVGKMLENKQMFLDGIGMMGLMHLTNDEKWAYMRELNSDLLSAEIDIDEKLFKEYMKITDEFNKGKSKQLKGCKTTARKSIPRKTIRKSVKKPVIRKVKRT